MKTNIITSLSTLLLVFNNLYAQYSGSYYVKAFDPKESRTTAQTWACIQDNSNLLYFASGNKIVTFDGYNWNSINIEHDANPLSFTKDKKGEIFVGGNNAIGFLGSSQNGQLKYYSLKHYNDTIGNIGNVWSVKSRDEYVYFSSSVGVLIWNTVLKKLEVIKAKIDLTLININDEIGFVDHDKGLCVLEKNKIRIINKNFKHSIIDAVSYDKKTLILTNNAGLIGINKNGETISNDTTFNLVNKKIEKY